MIIDDLKKISRQGLENRPYLLNLLKEEIQSYILYFTYTNIKFKDLIFTGGTCLRRIYGLNRLSVDLDFDYKAGQDPKEEFAKEIAEWFRKTHQIKSAEAIVKKQAVKVKLTEGLFENADPQTIFVSIDFSPIGLKNYKVEQNLISTPTFSFIVKNFDLPTMFANKICAFLERKFTFGKEQIVSFKARDVYDLFWLCQLSKQQPLKPNFDTIFERMNTKDKSLILNRLIEKIAKLDDRQPTTQLMPFFADKNFVESFVAAYKKSLPEELGRIFG